jgi:hypothetical protein
MRPDVFEMEQLHVGDSRRRIDHRLDRGDEAAREDETLDEVHRAQRLLVILIPDRDRLQQHRARRLEQ